MLDEKQMIAEIRSDEDPDTYANRCRARYPLYDRFASLRLPPWSEKQLDRPLMKLDGSGLFKWPALEISGRCTVPTTDMVTRYKMASNALRNTYFMAAKAAADTLDKEKACEILGYIWVGLGSIMVSISEHFFKEKPHDCLTLSKALQVESLCEGNDHDVVEETSEKFVLRFQCAWWGDYKTTWEPLIGLDIREPLCNVGCTGWTKVWMKHYNPRIRFTKTKFVGDGDDCCEFTFEMQKDGEP